MCPNASSYSDLALALWGRRFAVFTRGSILITWASILPYYLITTADSLRLAFPHSQLCFYQWTLIVSALLVPALQLRSLYLISYFATASTLAMVVSTAILLGSLSATAADPESDAGWLLTAAATAAEGDEPGSGNSNGGLAGDGVETRLWPAPGDALDQDPNLAPCTLATPAPPHPRNPAPLTTHHCTTHHSTLPTPHWSLLTHALAPTSPQAPHSLTFTPTRDLLYSRIKGR